jgi:hypothetical protein
VGVIQIGSHKGLAIDPIIVEEPVKIMISLILTINGERESIHMDK